MTIVAALAGLTSRTADSGRRTWWRYGLQTPRLAVGYRKLMHLSMQAPIAALLLAAFIPLAGFLLARTLGDEFFPPTDRNMFQIRVWFPNDSSTPRTAARAEAMDALLQEQQGIDRVYWLSGR